MKLELFDNINILVAENMTRNYTKRFDEILSEIISQCDDCELGNEVFMHFSLEVWRHVKLEPEIKALVTKNKECDKFKKCVKYYYFWCKLKENEIRFEHLFISICSIIEYLMTDDYKTFYQYLSSEMKEGDTVTIKNIKEFFERWRLTHGSTQKLYSFFSNYFEENPLLNSIEYWNDKDDKFESFSDVEELSRFLIKMRNSIVHKMGTYSLLTEREKALHFISTSSFSVDSKLYRVSVYEKDIINQFEEALFKYWYEK